MTTQKIRNMLAAALLPTALAVLINTPIGNDALWNIINAVYILVPLIFTLSYVRMFNGDLLIAILLWVPALVTIYMMTKGLGGIEGPVWTMTNMYQLLAYGYFGGTRLQIR